MRFQKLAAIFLAGTLTVASLSGCGINKNATIATMDGGTVKLGVANFMCLYQQALYDESYRSYGGDEVWSSDLFGMGSTMEDSMKEDVMNQLHEMYTLKNHMDEYDVEITDEENAQIKKAAQDFIDANDKKTLKGLGATEDIVEEVLTLYTIRSKMHEAVLDKVGRDVSDEEANMRAYTIVTMDFSGDTDEEDSDVEDKEGTEDLSEESTEEADTVDGNPELLATAEAIVQAVKAGTDLETAAKDNGQETQTDTYDSKGEGLDEEVKTALDALKEGETSDVITTDSAYVIVRIDKDTDEEATEENKETIVEQRYTDQLDEWQEDDGWEVKEKQMDKIQYRNIFKTTNDAESDEDEEEDTEDTGADEVTEVENGTE